MLLGWYCPQAGTEVEMAVLGTPPCSSICEEFSVTVLGAMENGEQSGKILEKPNVFCEREHCFSWQFLFLLAVLPCGKKRQL